MESSHKVDTRQWLHIELNSEKKDEKVCNSATMSSEKMVGISTMNATKIYKAATILTIGSSQMSSSSPEKVR
jgi:hypothetical protein